MSQPRILDNAAHPKQPQGPKQGKNFPASGKQAESALATLDLHSGEFPSRLTIELTNQCNYKCAMCPSRWQPDTLRGLMAPELFHFLVDQAAEHLPVTMVPFFRGESLLHPDALGLLAYAKRRGLGPVQLASNGWLLDEVMARGLLDTGLDFISFSVDTDDAEEYTAIRVGGELGRVKANVERFIALRDKGGYPTEIQVSATRTKANAASIIRFVDFWRHRADRTRIYYEHSIDGHTGSLECDEIPAHMERRPCPKVFGETVVYFGGQAALCNHDWFRNAPLGDLTKQSMAELWHSQAYQDIRSQHQDPATLHDEVCLHCDHWKIPYLDQGLIGELHLKSSGETP